MRTIAHGRFATSRFRGFTRVELLVVVGVLGILAALLLPALRLAKEKARMTKCLSNLREIGVALQMYLHDNDGRYPNTSGQNWISYRLGGGDPDAGSSSRFGAESATNRVLWKYTKRRELFHCPADRGMDLTPWMQPY